VQQFRGRPYANVSCEHLNIVFGAWTFCWWMKEKSSLDLRRIKLIHAAAILHGPMWSWRWKTRTIMELKKSMAPSLASKVKLHRKELQELLLFFWSEKCKEIPVLSCDRQQLKCKICESWTPRYCWLCQNKQYIERFYCVCLSHSNCFGWGLQLRCSRCCQLLTA